MIDIIRVSIAECHKHVNLAAEPGSVSSTGVKGLFRTFRAGSGEERAVKSQLRLWISRGARICARTNRCWATPASPRRRGILEPLRSLQMTAGDYIQLELVPATD